MKRLVWKFWAAIIVASLTTFACGILVITQWQHFESFSEVQDRPHTRLQGLAAEIESTLTSGGDLRQVLTQNSMTNYGHIFLINPAGHDVLGRAIPNEIIVSTPSRASQQESATAPIFARAISANNGELYFMIFQFHTPTHPFWLLFQWFGSTWVLAASIVISGIFSAWLAYIVSHPISKLAQISAKFGEGELDTPIDQRLTKRQDEIGALARQLKASATKISILMQRQKDFLRDVSHEVKTPLARLQIASESVSIDPSDKSAITHVHREVEVIDQLVQDLLHLSHSERPHDEQTFESIAIPDLLDRCVDRAGILATRKQIQICYQQPSKSLPFQGITFLLERVIDNLLTNAIDHTPANQIVSLTYHQYPHYCCIQVQDSGPGVPEKDLQNIFAPFVRLDSARQRKTGGFGLGLALVQQIVNLHDGKVYAENAAPCGLRITLQLPNTSRWEKNSCAKSA